MATGKNLYPMVKKATCCHARLEYPLLMGFYKEMSTTPGTTRATPASLRQPMRSWRKG